MAYDGFQEFIPVENVENLVQIPNSIPLEIASMLPGSALSAYNAVLKAQPHVEKLQQVKCKHAILYSKIFKVIPACYCVY